MAMKVGRPNVGTISQRGPHQFQARWTHGRRRLSGTFETYEAARAYLDALAKSAADNRVEITHAARKLTLANALRKRIALKPDLKSLDTQIRLTKRLIKEHAALCSKQIHLIDEIDVLQFIERRQLADVSNSTINRELSTLSNTFDMARSQMGCVALRNPIGPTSRLKEPRGRDHRLAQDEEDLILRIADEYSRRIQTPIGDIIRFAFSTAMRRSEIAKMDWQQVDFDKGTVELRDTKNGTTRGVPLTSATKELLILRGPQKSGPVWATSSAIASAWARVKATALHEAREMVAAGRADESLPDRILDLRFHDLRHEGTSRWIENTGWDNAKIKSVTGHLSDASLARYTHLYSFKLAEELAARAGQAKPAGAQPRRAELEHGLDALPDQRQQWRAVSASALLLKLLVWEMPLRDVAAEFGVSDVSVHKACRRLDIDKPPRGHWLKDEQQKSG